jgi:hypothetical protein
MDWGLKKDTLLISLNDVMKCIGRASVSKFGNLQSLIFGLAGSAFIAQYNLRPNRLALPPTSDSDRIDKMAGATKARYSEPQDKVNMPGWLTISEMLEELGESWDDDDTLLKDSRFRFWINRQLSDIYRGQIGEEPPTVRRNHRKAYCYPSEFLPLIGQYRDKWLVEGGVA